MRALSGRDDERGRYRQRFDYRNLGVEELGSVYESLLELHPEVNVPARTFNLAHGGSERRATGSHYTPPAILKRVLDFALEPAIARALSAADPEAALLDLKVLDPAAGSGHFLTAAAHRIARALARVRSQANDQVVELLSQLMHLDNQRWRAIGAVTDTRVEVPGTPVGREQLVGQGLVAVPGAAYFFRSRDLVQSLRHCAECIRETLLVSVNDLESGRACVPVRLEDRITLGGAKGGVDPSA